MLRDANNITAFHNADNTAKWASGLGSEGTVPQAIHLNSPKLTLDYFTSEAKGQLDKCFTDADSFGPFRIQVRYRSPQATNFWAIDFVQRVQEPQAPVTSQKSTAGPVGRGGGRGRGSSSSVNTGGRGGGRGGRGRGA